ncbi:fibronectin type III domain-containing protein 5b isoform X6 [Embiotoca jacksoni]|uniref:fibronectin type III domain-containing protein 5b isoform X6 n=1 Tax=Embiotoca jacksoni TaxID=100190 RepID=UPI0037041936
MPSSTTTQLPGPAVRAAPPAGVNGTARRPSVRNMEIIVLLVLGCLGVPRVSADSLSPPVNVTVREVKGNSAVVSWDIPEGDPVIGFAITQQKKDVRMLRFIQEVNTTTRSCALWDLEEETDYIVHVQSISMSGMSPLSESLRFRTPKEAETQASKGKDEVTMEEVGQSTQLRAGELIIIVVVLIMWAGVIALFCRQYDIIKDNEPNNNKDKAKNSSECSTPEHPTGGLLRIPQEQQQQQQVAICQHHRGVTARTSSLYPKGLCVLTDERGSISARLPVGMRLGLWAPGRSLFSFGPGAGAVVTPRDSGGPARPGCCRTDSGVGDGGTVVRARWLLDHGGAEIKARRLRWWRYCR